MSSESEAEPNLSEIEAALGALVPTRGRLDRDRVMYQAGRTSACRGSGMGASRAWMAVAASLGLVAMGEGALLARRPPERVVERVVVVREPASVPPTSARASDLPLDRPSDPPLPDSRPDPGPRAHDRLAWQVLRYGLDGLPAPAPSGGGDRPSTRRALREEIARVLELGDPS